MYKNSAFVMALVSLSYVNLSQAAPDDSESQIINGADQLCRDIRSIRLKDFATAETYFDRYLAEFKDPLMSISGDVVSDSGIAAASAQKLCSRVSNSISRGKALKVLDDALAACETASARRRDGKLKDAELAHQQYNDLLTKAESISAGALNLHPGSLQLRHCQTVGQNINKGFDKTLKQTRRQLTGELSRCNAVLKEAAAPVLGNEYLSGLTVKLTDAQRSATRVSKKAAAVSKQLGQQKAQKAGLLKLERDLGQCLNRMQSSAREIKAERKLALLDAGIEHCKKVQAGGQVTVQSIDALKQEYQVLKAEAIVQPKYNAWAEQGIKIFEQCYISIAGNNKPTAPAVPPVKSVSQPAVQEKPAPAVLPLVEESSTPLPGDDVQLDDVDRFIQEVDSRL